MRKVATIIVVFTSFLARAQVDSTLFQRVTKDTAVKLLNMDAIYNRPFLTYSKAPISIGGYAEANWQHLGTDGISEGHQFQMRRMTLFVASTLGKNLKFLSEIEFEEGGKKIAIEFASIDIEFHPLLNLRGGIIMNPIGAFNQNHDGPKWEFIDRPIASTQMLPATWSNAGFGVFGKTYKNKWMFGYELYVSGGFDNSIIDNKENKTMLSVSKDNPHRFEESSNGMPLTTGKIAVRHNHVGELGLSYMGGVYNTFEADGIVLDKRRRLDVFAIDFNTTLPHLNTYLTGEWAWIMVDVPKTYIQQYGSKQYGGFVDIVQPILQKKMFNWDNAKLNISCRFEYVDWNVGNFNEGHAKIGDQVCSVVPGISFRPAPPTVIRLNYRLQNQRDLLNNKAVSTAGFSIGISSYF